VVLQSQVEWWDLVRYGPPGFEVYLRIALARGEADVETDAPPGAVREFAYGEPSPLHRDDPR
jgi:hypothetical protein